MSQQYLSPETLLTTTRAVRKRLDFSRPVPPEIIQKCLTIALQAPSGGNRQHWHFLVVSDEKKRQALGDLYRRRYQIYEESSLEASKLFTDQPELHHVQQRVSQSAHYLAEHIHQAPIHLIPCISGRLEASADSMQQAGFWGSIFPVTWNFMLAARLYGLGTTLTTLHLAYEKEAADILAIPYEEITQAALVPVAYTYGTQFQPAPREPLNTVVHWDQW